MTYPHLLFNDNSYFVQKKLGSEFVCEFLRRIIDMAAFNPSIQVKHFRHKFYLSRFLPNVAMPFLTFFFPRKKGLTVIETSYGGGGKIFRRAIMG